MPLAYPLRLIFLISTALSLVLNVPQDLSSPTTSQVSDPLPIQIMPVSTNLPALSLWGSQTPATPNETHLTYVTYHCDGDSYGDPLAASCQTALEEIPDSTSPTTFEDRTTRRGFEMPLPGRVISRKNSTYNLTHPCDWAVLVT